MPSQDTQLSNNKVLQKTTVIAWHEAITGSKSTKVIVESANANASASVSLVPTIKKPLSLRGTKQSQNQNPEQ